MAHGSRSTSRRALDRRRRDLAAIFAASLGDAVNPLMQVAIRKAAELTAAAEMARATVLDGGNNAATLDVLIKLEGEARRAVRALGLKPDAVKSRGSTSFGPLRARLSREAAKCEEDARGMIASSAVSFERATKGPPFLNAGGFTLRSGCKISKFQNTKSQRWSTPALLLWRGCNDVSQ
jgi:hypothetical protein